MMDSELIRKIGLSLESMINDSFKLAKLEPRGSLYETTELNGITTRDTLAVRISERAQTVAYHIKHHETDEYKAHLTWSAYVSLIYGLTGVCIAELSPKYPTKL